LHGWLKRDLAQRFKHTPEKLVRYLHGILARIEPESNGSAPLPPISLAFGLEENMALISLSLGINFDERIMMADEDFDVEGLCEKLTRCSPFRGKTVSKHEVESVISLFLKPLLASIMEG
jgi:hypothetical protein